MFISMTAISPPLQTLLDVFLADLPDVRFGDIDAQSLARSAAEVVEASLLVAAAKVALEQASAALHERQESMLVQGQRALAYARVYAEADESLAARLDAVVLPRGARRGRSEGPSDPVLVLTNDGEAARRPRGRPRKLEVIALTPVPDLDASAFEPASASAGE